MAAKKRILIVNCYFDDLRIPIRRQTKFPQAMGPAYLAGAFSSTLCDIKLYNEQFSGPLEDEKMLSFPDMLVLTGLNTAFDRMLHITAYARTKNRHVIVVAGGPAIRALKRYSDQFFDYACNGDVEQLGEVIEATFGSIYVSKSLVEHGWVIPRYDLAYWMKNCGYVESSRNCYFKCTFCSLTGENRLFETHQIAYLRGQFDAIGQQTRVLFLDNNFGGGGQGFLQERLSLLKQLTHEGLLKYWFALLSAEFFSTENIEQMLEAGCMAVFSGVESFDVQTIAKFKKYQNMRLPQIEIIQKCLNSGLVFSYGLMMDVTTRSIAALKHELDFILDTPDIPLPSFISIAVPLLKTPFFYECIRNDLLLPNIKIRDMDSATLNLKPRDSIEEVARFIQTIKHLSGYRRKIARHAKAFFRIYRKHFRPNAIPFLLNSPFILCLPGLCTAGKDVLFKSHQKRPRTFVGSTEPLDRVYTPAFHVDSRFAHYFKPTMLTDEMGNVIEDLLPDFFEGVSPVKVMAKQI